MEDSGIIFQGWRLEPSSSKKDNLEGDESKFLTPDLGILYEQRKGVLAEAKKNFPSNQDFWMRTFEQLMSYDDDLTGWPSSDGKVDQNDIVLLLHQTRGVKVKMYYDSKKEIEIIFRRPFIIVQFNRSDERRNNYFFQKILGSLSQKEIDEILTVGKSIPMDIFVTTYSMIKLYDSRPPIPYMIQLIWTNVILPIASEDPKFEKLRKNQKIEIIINLDKIIWELQEGFTFHSLHAINSGRRPRIPRKQWVLEACESLVKFNEAEWIDPHKKDVKIIFRKYDDVLEHFITCCSEKEKDKQLQLFS